MDTDTPAIGAAFTLYLAAMVAIGLHYRKETTTVSPFFHLKDR